MRIIYKKTLLDLFCDILIWKVDLAEPSVFPGLYEGVTQVMGEFETFEKFILHSSYYKRFGICCCEKSAYPRLSRCNRL